MSAAPEMVNLSREMAVDVTQYTRAVLALADPLFDRLGADGMAPEVAAHVIAQALVRTGCKLACCAAREMGGEEPSRERWMRAASLAWDAVSPPPPGAADQPGEARP